jgi:hypothetical protein
VVRTAIIRASVFLFEELIGASIHLLDGVETAPATGGLLALGFRISLLLRFCPLAIIGLLRRATCLDLSVQLR